MIFQDSLSSLNPKKRIVDIIAEPLRNFENLTDKEERKRVSELLEIVGMTDDALYKYPHEFSGGQRQRIAIARALYQNPQILIFDEATSALDNESEKEITKAINNLRSKKIIFVIAHRLSTVENADKIAVLSDGKIIDSGSDEELSKRNEIYARLKGKALV